MGLREWLIPQDIAFFTLLDKLSTTVLKGAKALQQLVNDFTELDEKRRWIKEIERAGDEVVHEIYDRLSKTFITPLDHEDIGNLASRYDDVLDNIYAVANKIYLFQIKEPTPEMRQFADVILESVLLVNSACENIRKMDEREIDRRSIEVHRLENVADELRNTAVAELFKTRDPVDIIKLKEVYEFLETITDQCEDVADVIRAIVIKHA